MVHKLSNGTCVNDLEWVLIKISLLCISVDSRDDDDDDDVIVISSDNDDDDDDNDDMIIDKDDNEVDDEGNYSNSVRLSVSCRDFGELFTSIMKECLICENYIQNCGCLFFLT